MFKSYKNQILIYLHAQIAYLFIFMIMNMLLGRLCVFYFVLLIYKFESGLIYLQVYTFVYFYSLI